MINILFFFLINFSSLCTQHKAFQFNLLPQVALQRDFPHDSRKILKAISNSQSTASSVCYVSRLNHEKLSQREF